MKWDKGTSIDTITFMALDHAKDKDGGIVKRCIDELSRIFHIPVEAIISPKRSKELVTVRQIVCYQGYFNKWATLMSIAFDLGGRDHTTVIHNKDRVMNLLEIEDPYFMYFWNKFREQASNEFL